MAKIWGNFSLIYTIFVIFEENSEEFPLQIFFFNISGETISVIYDFAPAPFVKYEEK
jgi:hypothetical protein